MSSLNQLAVVIMEWRNTNILVVGKRFTYKDDHTEPCIVEIVGGQYYGTCNGEIRGISNFWDWRFVDADGNLTGHKRCGYNNGEHGRVFGQIQPIPIPN